LLWDVRGDDVITLVSFGFPIDVVEEADCVAKYSGEKPSNQLLIAAYEAITSFLSDGVGSGTFAKDYLGAWHIQGRA
jgi:hypothetical protein